ncbi:MAG: hypothetical protein IPJ65_36435 [Archangiaceae bacterium]|nr:hypothetical protein [Archangiaceae bacterium]
MSAALLLALLLARERPLPGTEAVERPATLAPAESSEPVETPEEQNRAAIEALQSKVEEMQAQIDSLRAKQDWFMRTSVKLSGYLDFGFFWVQGNGSGVRRDLNGSLGFHGEVPDTWVLGGDPLSTAINSRGDVADVGDSRAIRFDPVHAGGHPSFIVNALNLGLSISLMEGLTLVGLLDFLPRDRDLSRPGGMSVGDLFDLKLAYARYDVVRRKFAFSLFAGKYESLLGLEYRTQEAPDRITVTPSLLCRYTCGRPVGIEGRLEVLDRRLELSLALTNGTHQADFFTFTNETDFNRFKTVAGRLALRLPVGTGLEVNVSGAVGPQDRQGDDGVLQWHYGAAARLEIDDFFLQGEFVTGKALGKDDGARKCGAAPCLAYRSAYGLVAWRATRLLQPYLRVDWRSARHVSGADFAYVSEILRATVGVRVEVGRYVVLKAEYVLNRELAPLTEFPDDVFTTSLVVRY